MNFLGTNSDGSTEIRAKILQCRDQVAFGTIFVEVLQNCRKKKGKKC